ncbi:hypothetical protein FHW83_004244 [Duganella sp. SG902]|uniref:hypothetical protein n=1 Tax=Duganella sp. SG902 TaxID=2587016 RepID=UPI00159E6646|nr:hypothetical protein [Duganella sp. SG902]NVM78416.1 hypothetical protein [Duganella sp. SG902]
MPKQPLMTLKVSFDISQIRDRINWDFVQVDPATGQAGAPDRNWRNNIQFLPGQKFRIDIEADNVYDKPCQAITVVDCCLITRPQITVCGPGKTPTYAPPSPFVEAHGKHRGALVAIPGDKFRPQDPLSAGAPGRKRFLIWDGELEVGQVQSHWDLSFYVTLRLERQPGVFDYRVFYFDPESEVGNGMDPP